MFLKKLELSGFKSFAKKTTLDFLPACELNNGNKNCGISVIVGPNGSGKSNIADAIQWVMGEQSMKNLRGKKSEDIIFAGSGERTRLGRASASLYFDNSDKKMPLDFSEVVISRRLFRNGESEYSINGSRVRLIDIVDILAKAGIGKKSYCVVNQGMSDKVLNASLLERRAIIEDAAGVKQFQIKKERALKKLESTRNNLERVRDLVKEIEPHLKMLKRQADKVKKSKEISQKLKEKQVKLFAYLWNVFQSEKSGAYEEKERLGRKAINAQREADKLSDKMRAEAKEVQGIEIRKKLEAKKSEISQKLNNLEKDLVVTEGRIELFKERQSQQKIIQSIPVDLDYVQSSLEKIRRNQEELIEKLEKAKTLEELRHIKEFAKSVQQALKRLYADVDKKEVKVERSSADAAEEENIKEKIEKLQADKREISGNIRQLKISLEKIDEDINKEIQESRRARRRFFEIERELRAKQDESNRLREKFNEAKVKLARIEVKEEDLINGAKEDLKVDIKELKYDGKPVDETALEKEIAKLKVQMEQIGGIDPMALKEYQETNSRFNFLNQESADLEKAIRSLKEVAEEMDKKIAASFNEAFKRINEEFSKYFRVIFGGGNAKLIKTRNTQRVTRNEKKEERKDLSENDELENSEDELQDKKKEVGINISACPPGKKISSLAMLSGGERSLTSIALLFAIISFNPPPFAVLDEVEAALDETNAKRFNRIVKELSKNTQFIIITHNRETMRQASLLYGVTMGDDGVSKLLSVNLESAGSLKNLRGGE